MGSGKDTTGWIEFCIPLFRSLLLDALSGPIVENRQYLEDLLFPHVTQFNEDLSQKSMRLSASLISGLNGKKKWLLSGKLGATALQQCVVTLEAVKCRIDEKIKRIYIPIEDIPSLEKDDGRDVELELDENLEPLTNSLDLSTIALEARALALPDYPRSNNAEYVTRSIGIDDQIVEEENSQNPFAILNTLKEKLKS